MSLQLNSQSSVFPIPIPPNIPADVEFNSARVNVFNPVETVGNYTAWKIPAKAATTANITLSGLQTIDGYTTLEGDRILVKDQTTASENGIYIARGIAWTRAEDLEAGGGAAGTAIYITNGTANVETLFICTNDSGTDIVGTDDLVFTDSSGGGGGSLALNDGNIFVGSASNVATGVAPSGDVASISNAGAFTLADTGVVGGSYGRVTVNSKGLVVAGVTSEVGGPTGAIQYSSGTGFAGTGSFTFDNDSRTNQTIGTTSGPFLVNRTIEIGETTSNVASMIIGSSNDGLSGRDFVIQGGESTQTDSNGGDAVISGGPSGTDDGNAGNIYILGGRNRNLVSGTGGGGNVYIRSSMAAGTGSTSAVGGDIFIQSADGIGFARAGNVLIEAGDSATSSGAAGTLTMSAGDSTNDPANVEAGADVTITAGSSLANNQDGGSIILNVGSTDGTGDNGVVSIPSPGGLILSPKTFFGVIPVVTPDSSVTIDWTSQSGSDWAAVASVSVSGSGLSTGEFAIIDFTNMPTGFGTTSLIMATIKDVNSGSTADTGVVIYADDVGTTMRITLLNWGTADADDIVFSVVIH